jgi:hypothetical protein
MSKPRRWGFLEALLGPFVRVAIKLRVSQRRSKILEYLEEKAAGLYGGSQSQRRKFAARLSIENLSVHRESESTFFEYNG